jgi:hypothetical protein
MKKIISGERLPGIENDPLASTDADYKMDYSVVPGYMKREESTNPDLDQLKVEPMAESIKYIKKMMDKGREIRESH